MESHLAAECFVPQTERAWNEEEPLAVLQPTSSLPSLHHSSEQIRQCLCPSLPLHTIGDDDPRTRRHPGLFVPLRLIPWDLHFAIAQRKKRQHAYHHPAQQPVVIHPPGIPAQVVPPPRPAPPFVTFNPLDDEPRNLPSISPKNNSDEMHQPCLAAYCNTLERLLFAERRHLLLLYEQYARYRHDLQHVDPRGTRRHSSMLVNRCWLEMDGIADAQPPVAVGDTLLIRPLRHAAAVHRFFHHSVAPSRVIEIQTHVASVLRNNNQNSSSRGRGGSGTGKDRIQAIWLDPLQLQMVQQQFFASEPSPGGREGRLPPAPTSNPSPALADAYNIRIVPSPKAMNRCLTAIEWLRQHIAIPHVSTHGSNSADPQQQQQQQWAQSFLFPRHAPVLPPLPHQFHSTFAVGDSDNPYQHLNAQQVSFVQIMLQRTLHPEVQHVRGPLILTGPAGTGKTRTLLTAVQQILQLNQRLDDESSSPGRTTAGVTPTNGRGDHRGSPSREPPGANIATNQQSYKPRMRILLCTPSHTAADVITQRLGKFCSPNQLWRLYDADRPVNTVPPTVLQFCRMDEATGHFTFPSSVQELLAFDVVVCTCMDAHLLYLAGLTNHQLRVHRQNLERETRKSFQQCGIDLPCIPGVEDPHFTHLFIDEAAQASEPESLIPISVVVDPHSSGTGRKVEIALVGDPRQLSPQVFSVEAATAGLDQSLMERLLRQPIRCLGGGNQHLLGPNMTSMEELLRYSFQKDGQEQLAIFLTRNYRGHPSFLAVPSALFYSDKLQSAAYDQGESNKSDQKFFWLDKLRTMESLTLPVIPSDSSSSTISSDGDEVEGITPAKQYDFPIHFRGVIGKDTSVTIRSGFVSDSWQNKEEADAVVEIIQSLAQKGVKSQSIGVMAPFRGQVVLIRRLLRQIGLASINVGTIEDYQSVERDVIVLSLTRSLSSLVVHDVTRRMGVFGQPKRSNVAMTRAEHLFVVVGNPNIMMECAVWRQFLLFCHRNGLWFGQNLDDPGEVLSKKTVVLNGGMQEPATRSPSLALMANTLLEPGMTASGSTTPTSFDQLPSASVTTTSSWSSGPNSTGSAPSSSLVLVSSIERRLRATVL